MPNQVRHPDQAFRQLLYTLFEIQKAEWEKVSSVKRRKTKEDIDLTLSRFLANDRHQLQLNEEINLVQNFKLIPLPPLERDVHLVPFLTINYRREDSLDNICCRIYVLLLGINGRKIHGIGFRIESPESNCKENQPQDGNIGRHDFYHAQFFKSLNGFEYQTPPWLPEHQPSFPLWATQPVDALLNLILTLYGAQYYLSFLRSHGRDFASAMSAEFKVLNARLNRQQ